MNKYNILIGDDHVLILNGLKDFLLQLPQVESVDVALMRQDVLTNLNRKAYQIVFLDLHFGQTDGRDLAKEILNVYPNIVIAAISSFDDKETIKTAIHNGFKAYFVKSEPLIQIKNWIEAEQFDSVFLSDHTRKAYTNQEFLIDKKIISSTQLTEKEKKILKLLTEECTTKQIAEHLNLSEKTIENYRSNLMMKLEVSNVVGLVKKTILLGLLN